MKLYKLILADPPWTYRNKNTGGSMKSGASAKYDTLTVEEIMNLKVPSDKNCVLFLWVTVPMLIEGLQVMHAWKFKYKTMITWRKIMSLGMGFWFRGQTEHILVGIKGNIKAFRLQEANFIQAKALKHSHKPEESYNLIERATKALSPKLELFATKERDGWDCIGYEINGKDIKEILK